MCGIIAYLTTIQDYQILNSIIQSLKTLQNRGYDSSGVGVYNLESKKLVIEKTIGKNLQELLDNHPVKSSHFGFGHNRWSTHGVVTKENAHPHHSLSNNLYIVHNGTIDNMDELITLIPEFKQKRYSQTDSELFVSLIDHFLTNDMEYGDDLDLNDLDLKMAIKKTIECIKGPFAITVFCNLFPNEVYFCRRDLPLLIGFTESLVIASSESIGFYDKVDHFIELKNDDVLVAMIVDNTIRMDIESYIEKRVIKSKMAKTPYPFNHWTIKEIMEQPLTVMKSMNMGMRIKNNHMVNLNGLEKMKEKILKCNHVLSFGCGTSFHAGLVGSYLLKKLNSFDYSEGILASEFDTEIDIKNNMKDVLCIFLSQSGETKDLVDVLNITDKTDAINISVINTVNSLIARQTGCGVYVNASRENGVASTKSFTAQVVVLALIAVWVNQNKFLEDKDAKIKRTKMITSLSNLPLDIEETFTLFPIIKQITSQLIDTKSLFILGSGLGYCIAREGALKIKEISYIHAEAYSLLDLKHGPFALIENGTPIIVIAHDEKSHERSKNICSEIKTRHGRVIYITPFENIPNTDDYIQVPYNQELSFLLCLIPLQIMAYEFSLAKNIDCDFPKNLSKTITV